MMIDGVQMNMFDYPEIGPRAGSRFDAAIRLDCGFEGAKIRIYAAAKAGMDLREFMRKEYGIGGRTIDFEDGGRGFFETDGHGLHLWESKTKWKEDHTWADAERAVLRMIETGEYLTVREWNKVMEVRKNHNGVLPVPHPRIAYW